MKSNFKIGIAEKDITPDFSVRLSGYNPAIERKCEGVHDKIFARCVILETEETKIAFLGLPIVEAYANMTGIIKKNASEITGIKEENIIVHAHHSHSCPDPNYEDKFSDPGEKADDKDTDSKKKYRELVEKASVECISEAASKMFKGRIGFGSTTVSECGRNRRYLDYGGLPVDPEIVVIKIEDEKKHLRAVLFSYACHCTVMGVDSKLISSDWPHFSHRAIKNAKGNDVLSMFVQSTAGDINPGYSAGLSAVGAKILMRNWNEAERIGNNVGNAVLGVLDKIETSDTVALKAATSTIELPCRSTYPLTLTEAEKKFKEADEKVKEIEKDLSKHSIKVLERTRMERFFASVIFESAKIFYSGKLPKNVKAELQAVLVNDSVIISLPGEIFHEIGLAIKKGSPAKHTFIAELSNHIEARGYMPTKSSYQEGDYEVYSSYYSSEAEVVLVKESVKNIKKLFSKK